ncbi:MAG TPA: hypothetical protein VFH47_00050, partial [Candidatus Thermoplasmatota archaeon]|nr:hypothetical protein [Candidatus Thermoplasmatota archaeon]
MLVLPVAAQPPSPGPRGGAPENVEDLQAWSMFGGVVLLWTHPYAYQDREMYGGPDAGAPAEFHVFRRSGGDGFEAIAVLDARYEEAYLDLDVEHGVAYEYAVAYYDGVESCVPGEELPWRRCGTVTIVADLEGWARLSVEPVGALEDGSCGFLVHGSGFPASSGTVALLHGDFEDMEPGVQELPFTATPAADGTFDVVAGPFSYPAGSPDAVLLLGFVGEGEAVQLVALRTHVEQPCEDAGPAPPAPPAEVPFFT